MNTSENLKTVVDTFGRLSFMLETYVKLVQTGDHKDVAEEVLLAVARDASTLDEQIQQLLKTSTNVNE